MGVLVGRSILWVWAWWFLLVLMGASAGLKGVAGTMWENGGGEGKESQYCDLLPDQPNPPTQPLVVEQYTAGVEMARLADKDITILAYAEHHYDGPGNRIAIRISSKYSYHMYILDWTTKQMLDLTVPKHNDQDKRACVVRPLEDGTYHFPALWGSGQNLSTDTMVAPEVLLGVLNWTDANYKGEYEHRGMLASRWDWCGLTTFEQDARTTNVTMATYWSAPTWKMPEPENQRSVFPLGYEVVVWPQDPPPPPAPQIIKPEVHNILYYRPGRLDPEAFLIPRDLYCQGMVEEPGHPFPNFDKDRLFTFSLEVRESAYNAISWADGWYDFEKQLYRIDHDAVSTPREVITTSEMLDFNDGLSFTVPWGFGPGECKINIINDTKTDWADITGIGHLWADSPNAFFGADITNYTYYGPGAARYVVGSEWRGHRTDWPANAEDSNMETLWQWTFASKNVSTVTSMGDHLYDERQVPVSLRVTALHDIKTTDGLIPAGSAYIYQLYNFDLETDQREDLYSDAGMFDTYQCYSANWRDHLRFQLDVSSYPEVLDTPLFTSARFWEYWQKQLAEKATVSPLRITRVKTLSEETGEAWVEFVLLYRHPRIGELDPELFKHMTTGSTAKTNIYAAVNNQDIKFQGTRPDGNGFELVAKPGSLTTVVEPDCSTTTQAPVSTPPPTITTPHTTTPHTNTPHTTPTTNSPNQKTTVTGTQSSPASTLTSPSDGTTTPVHLPEGGPLYSSGELAGLGIGMLVTGMAMGAGGTFLVVIKKFHLTVLSWCGKGPPP